MNEPCRSCGAALIWAVTEQGKRMPLDAEPSEKGNILLEGDKAVYVGKARIEKVREAGKPLYLSHFATRPNAKSHQKEKA